MRISLIGAGNVATHLGKALYGSDCDIIQVYSRRLSEAGKLSGSLSAKAIDQLSQVNDKAELYILAVHDDAIAEVGRKLSGYIANDADVVHTSGSAPYDLLSGDFKNTGVFYPLQTFSKARDLEIDNIPFCINATSRQLAESLMALAGRISNNVLEVSDHDRAVLHVAAVFANNFSNYCFSMAQQICESEDIRFDLLHPLISETARKAIDLSPSDSQTGPAVRNDVQTMTKHMRYLAQNEDNKGLIEIYKLLSEAIKQM